MFPIFSNFSKKFFIARKFRISQNDIDNGAYECYNNVDKILFRKGEQQR